MATIAADPLMRDPRATPGAARRYTRVAIALHWLIAALILTNLPLGWLMVGAEGLRKFTLFQLHKSVGISVLALTIVRLGWRLANPPPAYPGTMNGWERTAAHLVHLSFYLLMLGMPLTGWIIVSASPLNIPTLLFGTVPLPHLGFVHDLSLGTRQAIETNVGTGHALLAYLFVGLIALHVAAALKHQFVERDAVLFRMLPRRGAHDPASHAG